MKEIKTLIKYLSDKFTIDKDGIVTYTGDPDAYVEVNPLK